MTPSPDASVAGPDGWRLTPEGAAVHLASTTAVVADVHLGYEWARGRGGDCVPAHSLRETQARLGRLLGRFPTISRLVVAGDLVESRQPCLRTDRDVAELAGWLTGRGMTLIALAGNHDPPRQPPLPASIDVAGWTIAHGDRRIRATRRVIGHHHPTLRAQGVNAPCFLVGSDLIVLPAFSRNAAGVHLAALDRTLFNSPMRCLATADDILLDFGPVDRLLRALAV